MTTQSDPKDVAHRWIPGWNSDDLDAICRTTRRMLFWFLPPLQRSSETLPELSEGTPLCEAISSAKQLMKERL